MKIGQALGVICALMLNASPVVGQTINDVDRTSWCKKGIFDASDWADFYEFRTCTNKGWLVVRAASRESDECVAIDPSNRLFFTPNGNDANLIVFQNLQSRNYILSSDQKALVRITIDKKDIFKGMLEVGISNIPPLRYSIDLDTTYIGSKKIFEGLAAGKAVHIKIAKLTWNISLTGSRTAYNTVKACVVQQALE